jgi:RND superfamily putative drug exporter
VLYLLDGHAWYMPRWLDRVLPRITIEPPTSGPEDEEEPAREAAAMHRAELPLALQTVVVDRD